MQKRPTNQTKLTNEAPAPMYQHQGPLGSVPEKDGGQRWQGGAGRTKGSAEPPLNPVQVHFCGKVPLILLMVVWHVSMLKMAGTDLHKLYKGPLIPLTTHTTGRPLSHTLL